MPRPNPPPHLRLRAVGGRPLPAAFEAAFAHRAAAEGIAGRLGRVRRRARSLPPGTVRGLCERLAPLGLEAPQVHAVPYLPLDHGKLPLVLVVTEAADPAAGIFLARRGRRWAVRPYLRRLVERLDPEGAHLRVLEQGV